MVKALILYPGKVPDVPGKKRTSGILARATSSMGSA